MEVKQDRTTPPPQPFSVSPPQDGVNGYNRLSTGLQQFILLLNGTESLAGTKKGLRDRWEAIACQRFEVPIFMFEVPISESLNLSAWE